MTKTVIKVENVSKKYRLGLIGMGTLRHDLNRFWARVRGKADPYASVVAINDRSEKATSDYVWALRDINFDVQQGEILAIIGKNGAGKSTLLKLLSKITQPTEGSIKMKGRIASLLEVGTGFHPELTGRENVYLNGTILGMTKKEVTQKLDEIVSFAGVEKYVDTPVKRYSSGMVVRLGFAVAAHLEPEILIVDEVLAVGDAAFQKKAIGKMKDVTTQGGRTVLFVSHNMQSVRALCTRAMLLENGEPFFSGDVNQTVNTYLSEAYQPQFEKYWNELDDAPGNEWIRLSKAKINYDQSKPLDVSMPFDIEVEFYNNKNTESLNLSLLLWSLNGDCIFNCITPPVPVAKGYVKSVCHIPPNLLNDGEYSVELLFVKDTSVILYSHKELLSFKINDTIREGFWHGKWQGIVRPKLDFKILQASFVND